MGTTRVKVIDLSSDKKEVKAARKHADKIAGAAIQKDTEGAKVAKVSNIENDVTPSEPFVPSEPSEPADSTKSATQTNIPVSNKQKKTRTTSAHHKGKKWQEANTKVDKTKTYDKAEAIDLLYKTNFAKFDPTVELHINVTEKSVRGSVTLPHPIEVKKKEKKVLVFSDKKVDTKGVIWADDATIGEIEAGRLKPNKDFDGVFAMAKFMPQLAKIAKVLCPAGMMPNPKNGTIIIDASKVEADTASDAYEFRCDPTAAIIHTKIGKLSNKPTQIEENVKALVLAIGPAKIKTAILTSTMGPGIKLDISSFTK